MALLNERQHLILDGGVITQPVAHATLLYAAVSGRIGEGGNGRKGTDGITAPDGANSLQPIVEHDTLWSAELSEK